MIYLTKGQKLFENPSMVVYEPTGYYEDNSTVICASALLPEEPVCRFEAKFIAYGSMVYAITDEKQLLEEILKLDPLSLFGKTAEDKKIDQLVQNIETVTQADMSDLTSAENNTTENDLINGNPTASTSETVSTSTPTSTNTNATASSTSNTSNTSSTPETTMASSSDNQTVSNSTSSTSTTPSSNPDTSIATSSESFTFGIENNVNNSQNTSSSTPIETQISTSTASTSDTQI